MQRETPLGTSLRSFSSGGQRGCVHEADDKPELQELKINIMKDEMRDKVEHPQNYGFTSRVLKSDKSLDNTEDPQEGSTPAEEIPCAEHFTQFMGGSRTFPVVQNLDDRRVRVRGLEEGEVAMYDDQQQKVTIKRWGILSRSALKIEQRVIVDEQNKDGHGRGKKASRDQTLDRSMRLSTIAMDSRWITIERTRPKSNPSQRPDKELSRNENDRWQEGGESGGGDPEKKIQMCSRLQLGERRASLTTYDGDGQPHLVLDLDEDTSLITMQTLQNGKPHLAFTLDEESGEISFENSAREEGTPNLVFEMDDRFRKITIATEKNGAPQLVIEIDGLNDKLTLKTNGKTSQVFDNNTGGITIHADKVIAIDCENLNIEAKEKVVIHADDKVLVGDKGADKPAAMEGSVDDQGHLLVGNLAQKVLVK